MDKFFKKAVKAKTKIDSRFTLFLIIGTAFLLLFIRHIIGINTPDTSVSREFSLKVTDGLLSMMVLSEPEIKISSLPWTLTPFFFEKLPINEADKETLITVKGVGPKLAESILKYRLECGPFKEGNDLMKVSGIGPKRALYFETKFDFGGNDGK